MLPNCDEWHISNPKVAAAQAYFAGLAAEIHAVCQSAEEVDRVYLRGDISDREKSLSHIAYRHGVDNYAFFQNAGYRGMYNMNIKALKNKKGLFDDKCLEHLAEMFIGNELFIEMKLCKKWEK
ncbi:hypothetical protein ACMXY9_09735 [Pasteurella multocida]|uniref:hypothetical protein n=1 Tax=Pasteurella multocida TaxID=747 RepID=UPI003CF56299